MLFTQIAINIGMNLGLLPVTGIPAPLLSYGGSSLLSLFLAFGMLESIYQHRNVPSEASLLSNKALCRAKITLLQKVKNVL